MHPCAPDLEREHVVSGPHTGPYEEWHRAVETRDPAYDGRFFVALTSTRIFCRPVCPSRLARPEHRRFFIARADAEAQGYRACRRCRPELAPGASPLEAVPRLANEVLAQIRAGALNGDSVRTLAQRMGLSDRHLRRALEREVGESPARLARTQRLHTALALLVDRRRSISDVAYTSGFQSLRRFNAAFREQYGMSPSAWRRSHVG